MINENTGHVLISKKSIADIRYRIHFLEQYEENMTTIHNVHYFAFMSVTAMGMFIIIKFIIKYFNN